MRERRKSRVVVLAASMVLVAGMLAACGGVSGNNSRDGRNSVNLGFVPDVFGDLPIYFAMKDGLFAKHGLNVNVLNLQGGAMTTAATSGAVDIFSQTPVTPGQAIQQGEDIKMFCGTLAGDLSGLVARPALHLPTVAKGATWQQAMKSLSGKTVGIAGPSQEVWMRGLAEAAGMNQNSIKLVTLGVGPAMSSALQLGQVDAVFSYPPLTDTLVAEGKGDLLFSQGINGPDYMKNQLVQGVFATGSWLRKNPNLARAYCDSMTEATADIQKPQNSGQVDGILAQELGVKNAQADDSFRANALPRYTTSIDCGQLDPLLSFLTAQGSLKASPKVDCQSMVWRAK